MESLASYFIGTSLPADSFCQGTTAGVIDCGVYLATIIGFCNSITILLALLFYVAVTLIKSTFFIGASIPTGGSKSKLCLKVNDFLKSFFLFFSDFVMNS
jgi:hypothetical protein